MEMTEAVGASGIDGLDALLQQVQALEAGLGGASAVAQAFDAELAQMKVLQRGNRLSITEVDESDWKRVLKLLK